jgi:hypothetical protein
MSIRSQHAPLSRFECELCGQQPAEFFMSTFWGERHICEGCGENLPLEIPSLLELPTDPNSPLQPMYPPIVRNAGGSTDEV